MPTRIRTTNKQTNTTIGLAPGERGYYHYNLVSTAENAPEVLLYTRQKTGSNTPCYNPQLTITSLDTDFDDSVNEKLTFYLGENLVLYGTECTPC